MMEGQGDRKVVCRGKVLLHMSDTVWLDRCQVMVRQPTLAKFVCTFETVSWLVREGLAMIDVIMEQKQGQFNAEFKYLDPTILRAIEGGQIPRTMTPFSDAIVFRGSILSTITCRTMSRIRMWAISTVP